jgi:hypothetical protein
MWANPLVACGIGALLGGLFVSGGNDRYSEKTELDEQTESD